jgi:hypothetical protein
MTLTCGVALCSYNGEQYLREQLDSILSQQQVPDAIVLCDDCSTDGTWDILKAFEASSPVPVITIRNSTRQGVVKNFERAIRMLDTDLIFLCDQDDIWLHGKVATVASIFAGSPETTLVFTDAVLVDGAGQEIGYSLFDGLQINHWEEQAFQRGNAFEVLCRRTAVTGATAAFRRSILSTALPFPDNCWHDEWLALIASATGKVVKLPSPTIKYRQHGKNVIGVSKPSRLELLRKLWWNTRQAGSRNFVFTRIEALAALAERINAHPGTPAQVREQCRKTLAFAEFRAALPQRFVLRLPAVLGKVLLGRYRRFGYWWKSDVFRDLIRK